VLSNPQDLLDELGVHLETCTNEASAAALLGASINYPIRGCVTWKSIVGTTWPPMHSATLPRGRDRPAR